MQILVSGSQVQIDAVEPEPVPDVLVQSEPVLSIELPTEPVPEVLVQSEPVDGLVDAPGHEKWGQKKWGPSGPGKKFSSMKKLCNVEPSSAKKSGKRKR